MPLAEWIDLLTPANARISTLDADPTSAGYGSPTQGADFPVGYQKLSSSEVQRLGREYGTDLYLILADLPDSGVGLTKEDTINVDGLGDMDVEAVIDYQQPDQRLLRVEAAKR